ncbi:MAG: hypothetical protein KatS3mg054_0125 [Chloroflexus sp.]|nr:MAG: hypothetical protein KatS3mg054_0125 [Chloroflexus sp.]
MGKPRKKANSATDAGNGIDAMGASCLEQLDRALDSASSRIASAIASARKLRQEMLADTGALMDIAEQVERQIISMRKRGGLLVGIAIAAACVSSLVFLAY